MLLAACTSGAHTQPPEASSTEPVSLPGRDIGISQGAGPGQMTDQELNQLFTQSRDLGAHWIRLDLPWSGIEQTQGEFDWERSDHIVNIARSYGLQILGVLAYTPDWARRPVADSTDRVAPANPGDFADFAGAAATHFGNRIDAYEVWNEPNIPWFWRPRVDASAYVALLKASYPRIKRADPAAIVVSAGLANLQSDGISVGILDYTRAMYAAGVAGYFDVMGSHPYTYPASPMALNPDKYNAFGNLGQVHDIMAANGDGDKKIWIAEYGAPTGTDPQALTPDSQSRVIVDGLEKAAQFPFVDKLFIYSMYDNGTDVSDREQNFGLIDFFGVKKPAYRAVQMAISQAS